MGQRIKHMPLKRFLLVTQAGHRQPDPVPMELLAAAVLFVITALVTI